MLLVFTVRRIEELCEENNISVTALENALSIAKGSIRTWGKIKPSIDKIVKIADYFGVSADYLLGMSDFRYSVEKEDADGGLVSLKRARSKMSEEEKYKMDQLMKISFPMLFKEDEGDAD